MPVIDFIREGFGAFNAEEIVRIVVAGLVILFVLGWRDILSKQVVPALMTSLGIFGTFWGIFNALSVASADGGLSPQNMITTIPALLGAMTTAFVTSLLGLGAAIASKTFWSWQRKDAPASVLSPEQRQILEHLDAIKRAIAGDDDSSLVSQIKNLRTDTIDGFKKMDGLAEAIRDALVGNLQKMMDDIREIIAERLGDQLQQLITNIEEALIKQFGKTFVEFNEAVQALKKWQEDHRLQVEQLTAAFDQAAQGIDKIRADCEAIPATMEKLRVVVEAAARHTENLAIHLEAFADMKKQAQESFPTIKENLDKIGNDLAESAKGLHGMEAAIKTAFAASIQGTENIIKLHTAEMERVVGSMRDTMVQAQSDIESSIKGAFAASKQETENIVKQHNDEVKTMVGGMSAAMTQAQRDMANKINGAVQEASEKFAKEINAEIDRLTKTWGDNMVGIAERCSQIMDAVKQSAANRQ